MRKFSVRRIILILIDLICIILASFLALFLRFNGEIPSYYFNILKNLMGLEIFISLVIFYGNLLQLMSLKIFLALQ